MNRINKLFATKSEKILSIYFCAGHPTLEGTVETIKTLEKKGVDMIEVGIPIRWQTAPSFRMLPPKHSATA